MTNSQPIPYMTEPNAKAATTSPNRRYRKQTNIQNPIRAFMTHSLLCTVTGHYQPLQVRSILSVKQCKSHAFGLNAHSVKCINENAPQRINLGGVDSSWYEQLGNRAGWPSAILPYPPKALNPWRPSVQRNVVGLNGPVAQKPNPTGSDSWMTVKDRCRELSGSFKDDGLQTGSERPLTAYSAGDRYSRTYRRMDVKRPGGRLIHDTDTVRIADKTLSASYPEGRRVSGTGVLSLWP